MFKFCPSKNEKYTHKHTYTVAWWRAKCRTSLDFLIAIVINRSAYSIMLHLNAKRVTDATIGRPSLSFDVFLMPEKKNFTPFRGDANSWWENSTNEDELLVTRTVRLFGCCNDRLLRWPSRKACDDVEFIFWNLSCNFPHVVCIFLWINELFLSLESGSFETDGVPSRWNKTSST